MSERYESEARRPCTHQISRPYVRSGYAQYEQAKLGIVTGITRDGIVKRYRSPFSQEDDNPARAETRPYARVLPDCSPVRRRRIGRNGAYKSAADGDT